jgi:hypothetical protein
MFPDIIVTRSEYKVAVYAPSGSGGVHQDRIMGTGGRTRVAAPKKAATAKKAAPKPGTAKKGMGFPAAAAAAGRSSGKGPKAGAAMVAAASRRASPAAKKANPNLKKVAMPKKGGRNGGNKRAGSR